MKIDINDRENSQDTIHNLPMLQLKLSFKNKKFYPTSFAKLDRQQLNDNIENNSGNHYSQLSCYKRAWNVQKSFQNRQSFFMHVATFRRFANAEINRSRRKQRATCQE